ncbi:type I restriction enzyme, S subunit [Maribacter sedimenticola]|uniref:Type I restriction enzyme, S subunit n=1 Tax=Maribacter sedimenticola TaxID=228956 RepID=A0ABY1SJ00_9FLAO|nr:restriction endonuclease subunit S [Maribacter sedimenticola]SNR60329.1 type I restriction enzyme, S subunit [Maribacter sedimenticola]
MDIQIKPFSKVLDDSTRKFKKIPKGEYLSEGLYPIIDQSKDFIAGYTNDENLVNSQNLPVIIFGDHTKAIKYVDFPIALGADGAKALTLKTDYARYVYYTLKNLKLPEAGYSRHFKFLKESKLAIPKKIDDQKRIAQVLTDCEELIAKRKESIALLDELLKSTFLEMFGDIRAKKSPYKWEKFRPYIKAQSGKSSKLVKSIEKTDFPIYGGNGTNGWATKPLYNKPIIIAGRVGQHCGVIHKVNQPCWVTDNAIVLTILNKEKLNITYLSFALSNSPILEKVKQLDLPFINQSMILDITVPIPPFEIQNKFEKIVKEIEKANELFQNHLFELENLYGRLSQDAFKGELDLSKVVLREEFLEDFESSTSKENLIEEKESKDSNIFSNTLFDVTEIDTYLENLIKSNFGVESFVFDDIKDLLFQDSKIQDYQDNYDYWKTNFFSLLKKENSQIEQCFDTEEGRIKFKLKDEVNQV